MIEPNYFLPVIPMVLINGCDGVGTGWSTSIPKYDPLKVIRNVRLALEGDVLEEMTPWYRNFKGHIGYRDMPLHSEGVPQAFVSQGER